MDNLLKTLGSLPKRGELPGTEGQRLPGRGPRAGTPSRQHWASSSTSLSLDRISTRARDHSDPNPSDDRAGLTGRGRRQTAAVLRDAS